MNKPTPRTDAAWSATFDGQQMSAGQAARTLREHSQQLETELATLTTERDHWEKIAVSASREREHNANVAQAMTAERDQLRAEVERLNAIGSWSHTCIHHTDEERKAWAACPCCLAADRARLDWLAESWDNPLAINLHPSYGWSEASKNLRASIDAAMKEGAK